MTSLPIELPDGYTILVAPKDHVTAGQLLAQRTGAKEEIVNIPQMLRIPIGNVKKVLKKNPGDAISVGDTIAQTSNFFGKKKRAIVSEVTGTVARFDRKTGKVTVLTDQLEVKGSLKSPVAGVVGLCNNREIVIKTADAIRVEGVAIGNSNSGKLFILEESFSREETKNALYYLDSRAVEKIVTVKKLTRDLFMKGMSIGVKGFLTIELDNDDITYFVKKDKGLAILEITSDVMQPLRAWQGKNIFVDTQTKAIIVTKV